MQRLERAFEELSSFVGGSHGSLAPHDGRRHSSNNARRLETIETLVADLASRSYKQYSTQGIHIHDVGTNAAGVPLSNHPGTALPFNSFATHATQLQPSHTQIWVCWRTFLQVVDPLAKVLHSPSVERLLQIAMCNATGLTNGGRALLFAVYSSAISSMAPAEVEHALGMSKSTALTTYRTATEQALTRAEFLTTNDLTTVQAFVLFLSFRLYTEEARHVWPLTGLARRLSCQTSSNITPFEAEMRRRLWWQLWYLDRRASEDIGKDEAPAESTTRPDLPLNVNDEDLDPAMTTIAPPSHQSGWTDMGFFLVRLKIAEATSKIEGNLTRSQKEMIIDECASSIESTHLRHCSGALPIHWLARHVSYVLITEMLIKVHMQGVHSTNDNSVQTQAARDYLFKAAIDIVDTPRRLETEPEARRWKWSLKAYLQYLPLAFLLTELCHRPRCEVVSRAWQVAEQAFMRWAEDIKDSKHAKSLSNLMAKAKAARWEYEASWHYGQTALPTSSASVFSSERSGMGWVDLMPTDIVPFNDIPDLTPIAQPTYADGRTGISSLEYTADSDDVYWDESQLNTFTQGRYDAMLNNQFGF